VTNIDPPGGPRPTPRAPASPPRTDPIDDASIWTDEPTTPSGPDARSRESGPLADAPRSAGPRVTGSAGRVDARTILRVTSVFLVGVLIGVLIMAFARSDDSAASQNGSKSDRRTTTSQVPAPSATPSTDVATTTTAPTTAVPATSAAPTAGTRNDLALATALGPVKLPSDCPLPLGIPEDLPNAARAYRGGVHEGIDFICGEYGRTAVAAMDGQVLVADDSFVDPTPDQRLEILNIAKQIGHTPPWTLAMLFGRFVVLDHGIKPGVGHVVTIYAHLNKIDPAIVPGHHVNAGDRIGEIGKAGTESAGTGEVRPQAIHLHWEIHVDDHFLAEGSSSSETSAIYAELFGR